MKEIINIFQNIQVLLIRGDKINKRVSAEVQQQTSIDRSTEPPLMQ